VTTQTALAAAASLVALAFALSTFERWLTRRRRHELAWSVALGLFFCGSAALWLGAANGWNGATFRAFYLFGAIVNVPVLALGTIYLLGGPKRGDRWALAIAMGSAFAAGVLIQAPLRAPIVADRLPQGSDVFGPLPRVLAAVASAGGALVVLGGAAWSAWRFRRGRMLAANLLIAGGTLVLGTSGLLNSVLDEMDAFSVTLAAGVTLLFLGFLLAAAGPAGAVRGSQPAVDVPAPNQ